MARDGKGGQGRGEQGNRAWHGWLFSRFSDMEIKHDGQASRVFRKQEIGRVNKTSVTA